MLTVLAGNAADLVPAPLQRLRPLWALRKPAAQLNTPEGSRENISRHYDLSNDLFALFLDGTLSYSSAVFRSLPATQDLLTAAQHRKIDLLLDAAGVGREPGSWRSAPAGANWPSERPPVAPGSSPSPSPPNSASWPVPASARPGTTTGSRSGSATTGRSPARTTPSSASR